MNLITLLVNLEIGFQDLVMDLRGVRKEWGTEHSWATLDLGKCWGGILGIIWQGWWSSSN